MRKFVLLFLAVLTAGSLLAQNRQVSGTVTNPEGAPVAGAMVVVADSNIATVTDSSGQFSLYAPATGEIRITMLGMETAEFAIDNRSVVDVKMSYSSTHLEDVIVVAFGTAKKEAFTGSAGVISSTEIEKRTSTNVLNTMAGQLPGVQIRNSDGQPGSEASMRIRGITSLNAGNTPLIVVDGAPYSGNLSSINPADIENITVLKDASSTALYGARAANGVVMITTKRASKKEAVINFDAKWGVGTRAAVNYDYVNDAAGHYELVYKGMYNYAKDVLGYTDAQADAFGNTQVMTPNGRLRYNVYDTHGENLIVDGKLNPNATLGNTITALYDGQDYYLIPDNWEDNAFKKSFRQEYNLSINGGSDRSSFYMSLGYLNDQGIVQKSSFDRVSARVKADYQAKKWLKVGANVAYAHTDTSVASGYDDLGSLSSVNIFAFTSRMAPIYPLFMRDGETKEILVDERGFKRYDYGDGDPYGYSRPYLPGGNPVSAVQLDDDSSNGNMFNLNGFMDITFMEGLKLNVNATTYVNESRASYFTNPWYGQYAESQGSISKDHNRYSSLNFVQMLSYGRQIDKHNFDVMVGHENYDYRAAYLSGSRDHMFGTDVHELNAAVNVVDATSSRAQYNTEGYFARAQYNYDNRIFGSASFRRDATSRFHPDYRWGNFWSVGAAWVLSNEKFLDNASWINMLKVKASYGTTGNDQIGDFRYVDTYEVKSSDDQASVTIKNRGNPTISWETNANFNAGVEFELFSSRLIGEIEYYNRTTYDMLFSRPLPESTGYSAYYDNIGDMRNSGLEVGLTGVLVRTRNLNLNLYANITTSANKILRIPPERVSEGTKGFASGNFWIGEGSPMYSWYLPEFAGVNPDNGKSLWYTTPEGSEDPNKFPEGDRGTTEESSLATYYNMGSALPDAYGGFGLNFSFYGFDLSVNFDYQIGGLTMDSGYRTAMRSLTARDGQKLHKDLWNAWTVDNPDSQIPRFQYGDSSSNATSSRFLTSSSYLNLQNINLGYTLPAKWTNKIRINSIRVFCSAENIVYWSKRKGLDTRQSWDGSSLNYNYSPIRTISGGLQFTF